MKKIIITGGLGMIGSRVVKQSIQSGYYPIIIDNLFNGRFENLSGLKKNQYALIKSDINQNGLLELLKKHKRVTAIIHCAAIHYIPYCTDNPQGTVEANVLGTINMLDIGAKLKIKKFIFASSAAVYKPKSDRCKETDQLGAIDIYGQTKIIGESLIKFSCLNNNISYSILRLFNVYGENNLTPHIIPSVIKQVESNNIIYLGNLNTYRDYIFVDDVAQVFISALTDKVSGIYNIGTGQPTSVKKIVETVANLADKEVVIKQKKVLIRSNDRKYLVADSTKARKHFHWFPTTNLKNGLSQILN